MTRGKRKHQLVITVTFDKPVGAAVARREVANNIHGTFWTSLGGTEADSFKVQSFKPMPDPALAYGKMIMGK